MRGEGGEERGAGGEEKRKRKEERRDKERGAEGESPNRILHMYHHIS